MSMCSPPPASCSFASRFPQAVISACEVCCIGTHCQAIAVPLLEMHMREGNHHSTTHTNGHSELWKQPNVVQKLVPSRNLDCRNGRS